MRVAFPSSGLLMPPAREKYTRTYPTLSRPVSLVPTRLPPEAYVSSTGTDGSESGLQPMSPPSFGLVRYITARKNGPPGMRFCHYSRLFVAYLRTIVLPGVCVN